MSVTRWLAKAEGLFWQMSAPARRLLRHTRREVGRLRLRLRPMRRGHAGFTVRWRMEAQPNSGDQLPGVVVHLASDADPLAWAPLLAAQSETAWVRSEDPGSGPRRWCVTLAGQPSATVGSGLVEALLTTAELENLDWIADDSTRLALLRLPEPAAKVRASLGKRVAFPPTRSVAAGEDLPWLRGGPYRLGAAAPPDALVERALGNPTSVLPAHPGDARESALLLMPFVAVGGAERLLLDFVRATADRRRYLAVTTEPHRPDLGELLSELQTLIPVLPVGDLLHRDLHVEAVATLLRRHRADALVSWNPTGLFFESATALRARFPALRIVSQLFDHRTGWIRRLTPDLIETIDVHLAVNGRIADELRRNRGVPRERIALVRHGIAPPPARDLRQRRALRDELSLGEQTVLVTSLIRIHPQKRPLDVLAVARRLESRDCHFLIVGGGPAAEQLAEEISRARPARFTWLPLDPAAERWLDATDLCLLASAYEGLPLFLLEGLSRGIPCVATAVGEIPALLEGGAGRTAPPGDVAALAAGVEAFLDPTARQAAGAIGREQVLSDFALDRFVDETERVIFGART